MSVRRLLRSHVPGYDQRPQALRISITVTVCLLALLVCEWLRPLLAPLYEAPFIGAVVVVSWLAGPWHGLAATLGCAVLLDYFFLAPTSSLALQDSGAVLRFFVFMGANAVVVGLIANLHRVKTELDTSEQAYRRISELIPFGTWTATRTGAMQRVSESFLRTFGATPEECRGFGWLQFIDDSQREQVRADWTACMRSGYFWDAEYQMKARSGETYYVLSRGVPIRSRRGSTRYWVGIHLDITAMRRALEDRVAQARDLARFNAELEQFAYISAHDLQEPLRMIASYVQLLERRYRGKLDADADTYIGYAVEGANRLRALLQDLLVLQQVGKPGRPRTRLSVRLLVEQAIANLGEVAKEAAIHYDDLPEVVCDEREFVLVFENLIDNAIQYTRDGVRPEVCISAERTGDAWQISVADNGIGIASEYHTRIFNVFQRLHSLARFQGTGIGLAIAKKIVEVHGGRIWVESTPGQGATFHFTVPT